MIQRLLRKDVLVKLPSYTEETTRKLKSGLFISAMQEQQRYAPTSGYVIKTSETDHVKEGDAVFFGSHLWSVAKDRAFGSKDERFKKMYFEHKVFALKEDDGFYMIIPEKFILFIKRGEEIIPINDYVIATPLSKENVEEEVILGGVKSKVIGKQHGGLLLVDLQQEKYKINMAVVFASPDGDLKKGDVVHTLKHCDIFVENELNNPILPEGYFFIEKEDIVAKVA